MFHSITEDKAKRLDELIRIQNQHDTDIKRLWRYISQLQGALRTAGVAVPPPEA